MTKKNLYVYKPILKSHFGLRCISMNGGLAKFETHVSLCHHTSLRLGVAYYGSIIQSHLTDGQSYYVKAICGSNPEGTVV